VLLFPLPEGVTAHQVRPALATAVLRLPEQLRRSLTWDQGREMAEHLQFTIDSGVQVYVCDPRSLGSVAATRTLCLARPGWDARSGWSRQRRVTLENTGRHGACLALDPSPELPAPT
jgi:hypothetical protein